MTARDNPYPQGESSPASVGPLFLVDGWRLHATRAGIAVAAAAALAYVMVPLCRGCGATVESRNLAIAGGMWYSLLLGMSWSRRLRSLLSGALAISSGVHGFLAYLMLVTRNVCPFCMVAALSAGFAALVTQRYRVRVFQTLLVMALGCSIAAVQTTVLDPFPEVRWGPNENVSALDAVRGALKKGPSIGVALLSRAPCGFCEWAEREHIPALRRRFGSRVEVSIIRDVPEDHVPVVPTFLLIRDGRVVGTIAGLPATHRLLVIAEHIQSREDE